MKSCDPSSEKVAYIFDTNCYFLLLFRKPKYCYLFSGTSLKTRANSFGRVNYGTTGSFFRHCYALVVIFLLLRENMILSINDHFSFQFIESTSLIVKKNSPIMWIQVDQGQIFQWIVPPFLSKSPLVQFSDQCILNMMAFKWRSSYRQMKDFQMRCGASVWCSPSTRSHSSMVPLQCQVKSCARQRCFVDAGRGSSPYCRVLCGSLTRDLKNDAMRSV